MADAQKNDRSRPTTPNPILPMGGRPLVPPGKLVLVQTTSARPATNLGPLSPVNQNGSFAFDRVIKRGKVETRIKKKGAWKSSWKPAYLVLRPNLLSVYKDADETELRASITLSDVTAVAPVKKSHQENVFGIFSPTKNHHFSGLSVRETQDWIAVIRLEAHTEDQTNLDLPNAGFQQTDSHVYDSTDLSADDDPPASPEAPQWKVNGAKRRVIPQPSSADPRRTSGLAPYPSGNESFATSQSDFSDGFAGSQPGTKTYLSASAPIQPSVLTPIPDDVASSSARPNIPRAVSYLSSTPQAVQSTSTTSTTNPAKPIWPQPPPSDPSRVIRQGNLRLSKTTSGVKQWKSIWLVLRTQSLSFYKSPNEYQPMLVVPLHSIIEAAEIDGRKHKQNCFQVIGEEKTYRLQADTESELESWLGAFKSVLVKLQQQQKEQEKQHQEVEMEKEREKGRTSRGVSLSSYQQPASLAPALPPASRDGVGGNSGMTIQMRSVSFESQRQA